MLNFLVFSIWRARIQSLIKSSEKELSGFVSAFLRAHHKTIQNDLAVLAQETISTKAAGWDGGVFRYA